MLLDASRQDEAAWNKLSKTMSRGLAQEIKGAPIGHRLQELQQEQVKLITSIPEAAADRVHKLAAERMVTTAGRADEITREILKSEKVSAAKASTIARTETARVSSNLTQARAEYVGSEGYIWRSSGDLDVRPLHRKLNGKFIRWDTPPVSGEKGERAHAGCIYNCRCYAEPVVPEERDEPLPPRAAPAKKQASMGIELLPKEKEFVPAWGGQWSLAKDVVKATRFFKRLSEGGKKGDQAAAYISQRATSLAKQFGVTAGQEGRDFDPRRIVLRELLLSAEGLKAAYLSGDKRALNLAKAEYRNTVKKLKAFTSAANEKWEAIHEYEV
jgi:SPP1 gp7 family putative phage head morphogenesis protein